LISSIGATLAEGCMTRAKDRYDRPVRAAPVTLLLALVALTGCAPALNLAAVEDARAVMRVKTALVNDPVLGVLPIEVRVVQGRAYLSGGVPSKADVQRAIELVRSVNGITDVRSDLQIGLVTPPTTGVAVPQAPAGRADEPTARSFLGVGVSFTRSDPSHSRVMPAVRIGPTVRVGIGRGLGPVIGFSWTRTELVAPVGRGSLGCLNVRPVMGGLGYTIRRARTAATLSTVGGIAFNSLCDAVPDSTSAYALRAENSLAWRAGLSASYEASSRVALTSFLGYLVARPRLTMLTDGQLDTHVVRADTVLLSVGVLYKVF
jgi:hypothetical protein